MRLQLEPKQTIRTAILGATCAVLGAGAGQAEGGKSETSLLVYSENERINARAIAYKWSQVQKNESVFGFGLTYDAMTGASPTGAAPSLYPQTVTGSSGSLRTEVPANTIPANDRFKERRLGLNAHYSMPVTPLANLLAEVHLSSERDYLSLGINGGIAQGFDRGRTVLEIRGGYSGDLSKPPGGNPYPLTEVIIVGETNDEIPVQGDLNKQVYDALFSLSRELGSRTIIRGSYAINYASGYLNDPYKVVSLVRSPDSTDPGEPVSDIYEKRPATRMKHALFIQLKTDISGSILDVSARGFRDDWGVQSVTGDLYYRVKIGKTAAIEPHLRGYFQTAANFYKPFLIDGQAFDSYVSADSRLAEFMSVTYGLTYSIAVSERSRLSFTGEGYRQMGDNNPKEAFGNLKQLDLFPELKAIMLRVGLEHSF